MITARERFDRDPVFHTLVMTMYAFLESQHARGESITPSELREAAMLAAMMFEERHVRPLMFYPPEEEARG